VETVRVARAFQARVQAALKGPRYSLKTGCTVRR
jgi:hypothetical protein